MEKSILVLWNNTDFHGKYVYETLQNKWVSVYYFDIPNILDKIKISYSIKNKKNYEINIDWKNILVKSIYWRNYNVNLINDYVSRLNMDSCIKWLFYNINCVWVNKPSSVFEHWTKRYQLLKYKKNKILIPKTYITNNFQMIEKLSNSKIKYIFKPVLSWFETLILENENFSKLEQYLKNWPITIQEYIPWDDFRVYVVWNNIYWIKLQSNKVDFREDNEAKIYKFDLDDTLKNYCLKVIKIAWYKYSAIDMKKWIDGKYYILEANPSPMFYKFEKDTWYPILEKLTDLLINW